jgi:hypothetical protein
MTDDDAALDWLVNWASAQDWNARDHYFHIAEGRSATCGCSFQGEN